MLKKAFTRSPARHCVAAHPGCALFFGHIFGDLKDIDHRFHALAGDVTVRVTPCEPLVTCAAHTKHFQFPKYGPQPQPIRPQHDSQLSETVNDTC
jgi:hypothetical protein